MGLIQGRIRVELGVVVFVFGGGGARPLWGATSISVRSAGRFGVDLGSNWVYVRVELGLSWGVEGVSTLGPRWGRCGIDLGSGLISVHLGSRFPLDAVGG